MSQVRRLSLVLTFLGSLMIFLVAYPPPRFALAEEVASSPLPESVGDLAFPAFWFFLVMSACWVFTEWVRGINPGAFAPKPATWQSRLLTRLISLFCGLVIGGLQFVPTLGDERVTAYLAVGGFAGIAASICNPFYGRLKRVLEKRALSKAAGQEQEPADE